MPANRLASLSIRAIDELSYILNLQELLQIALEELGNPSEKSSLRVDLLLGCYLSHALCHFQELQINLNHLKDELCQQQETDNDIY